MIREIDYNEQMLNYYPEIIKDIREFRVMIAAESPEVTKVSDGLEAVFNDSYVSDAEEERITQWEKFLGIVPLPQGDDTHETWLQDRRETILARLYSSQKLNSTSISDIVKIFTGGSTRSYFKDGTIYVYVTPPANGKQYKFENVEQELRKKVPAHLNLYVARNYSTWGQVEETYETWGDVYDSGKTWEEILYPSGT